MTRAVVLIGGGEHARVVAEAVRSRPELFELRGFVDPAPCEETELRLGLPRLGDDTVLAAHPDALVVIALAGIRNLALRREIAERCRDLVAGFATVVHARAWVSPTATLEEGAVVMAGAVVQSGARLGENCIVNSGAIVEHDVTVGAYSHVAPSACIGGGTMVGEQVFIGLGAAVRDHIHVGTGASIAMGTVVVSDVAPNARLRGGRSQ